jgi:outer membrane scaffolding protein for murein synthesis (MipA/OmpV family)
LRLDRWRTFAGAGCAAAILAPAASHAEEWIVTIGARLGAAPPYEGAGHDNLSPSGMFNVRPADKPYRFTPPDGGSTIAILATRYIDLGPMVRFRYDRGDTGKLQGLDKIGIAVEPGVFVNLWPTNWFRIRLEGRRGVTTYSGWVADAGLDFIHTGRRWDFSIGPRAGYGDRHYMGTYFGVTPQEAARSPVIDLPYNPRGGERYLGIETAASYHVTNRFRTYIDFGYHRLGKIPSDSPIVQLAGSREDISGSIGASYSFGVNIGRKKQVAWN